MNFITVSGYMSTPEFKEAQGDSRCYMRFSILDSFWNSKAKAAQDQWFIVYVYDAPGRAMFKWLERGNFVTVYGQLRMSEYIGREGTMRQSCNIVAKTVCTPQNRGRRAKGQTKAVNDIEELQHLEEFKKTND